MPHQQPLPESRDPSGVGPTLPKAQWLGLSCGLLAASLLWLSLSSRLTAAGQRIAVLEGRRTELSEAWIIAVLRHNRASDPARLRQRAAAMGFQPVPGSTQQLWLADPRALGQPVVEQVDHALGTTRRAAAEALPTGDDPDFGGMLLDLGVAASARADVLPTGEGR